MALVYIADDEPNIRKLVAFGLKDSGYEPAEFADGNALLQAVKQRRPDAIILDWMMPPPDGLAVCRMLREEERTRDIPVLMLTARGEEFDRVLGLEIGAALCCAFLALMAGGILCFLRRYVTVRFTSGCSQCC